MRLWTGLFCIVVMMTFAVPCQAQTSELCMIWGPSQAPNLGVTYIYQGGVNIWSWNHAALAENALAVVGGTARQVTHSDAYNGGTEYTLTGVPTGTTYDAAESVYDATSDGVYIYGWNWFSSRLDRYDLDWQFIETVFDLPPQHDKDFMGVTWDPVTNSVWLAPWVFDPSVSGFLYNYDLEGNLLGTIALDNPDGAGNGLALDWADDTFWFFSWTDQRYEQYMRDGTYLGSIVGMTRIYGAEFEWQQNNLLKNSEFHTDLKPWYAQPGVIGWSPTDHQGSGASGSMLVTTDATGDDALSECVSILPDTWYGLYGEFYVESPQTGGVLLRAWFYEDHACTDLITGWGSGNTIVNDAWWTKGLTNTSPPNALSAIVDIRVFSDSGSAISVFADHVELTGGPGNRLSLATFEIGDLSEWSSSSP